MAAQSWRKFIINYQYFTVDNARKLRLQQSYMIELTKFGHSKYE